MEKIKATLSLGDDGQSIVVRPEGEDAAIVNNSVYKITITGLKDVEGNTLPPFVASIRTPYSPLYCSLDSLKMVVDTFGIPDENMLSYRRQASKEADFITGGTAVKNRRTPDFAVEQFVRTKATFDCLSRGFMDRAYSGAGAKYVLDTAEFQDSLNSTAFRTMLDRLAKELQKWQDAIRGYYNEGRVKPKATRLGIKSSQNSDVKFTSVDTILQDATRSMPRWS